LNWVNVALLASSFLARAAARSKVTAEGLESGSTRVGDLAATGVWPLAELEEKEWLAPAL
jgi:hypothetical protein